MEDQYLNLLDIPGPSLLKTDPAPLKETKAPALSPCDDSFPFQLKSEPMASNGFEFHTEEKFFETFETTHVPLADTTADDSSSTASTVSVFDIDPTGSQPSAHVFRRSAHVFQCDINVSDYATLSPISMSSASVTSPPPDPLSDSSEPRSDTTRPEVKMTQRFRPINTSKKRKRSSGAIDPRQNKRERNRVSASKYRKRRKVFVDSLNKKVYNLTSELCSRNEKISSLKTENKILKEQLDFLKNLLSFKNDSTSMLLPSSTKPLGMGMSNYHPTARKTGLFMFVLFACFLLFNPSGNRSKPEIKHGRHGRVLLSYPDVMSTLQQMYNSSLQYDFGVCLVQEPLPSPDSFLCSIEESPLDA